MFKGEIEEIEGKKEEILGKENNMDINLKNKDFKAKLKDKRNLEIIKNQQNSLINKLIIEKK